MKKRLLALALCLVMMTSLLPLTAAAEEGKLYYVDSVEIDASGVKEISNGYTLDVSSWEIQYTNELGIKGTLNADTVVDFSCNRIAVDENTSVPLTTRPMDGETYYVKVIIACSNPNEFRYVKNRSPKIELNLPGYKTSCKEAKDSIAWLVLTFSLTKDHDWKFTVSENRDKLTAQCQNQECRKEVSVSLKADSVTLPKSPFDTARLEGWEAFKQAVPSAYYNSFDYKLNGEDVTDQSNPKAGNYQVGVRIYGLPGNVEYEGVASRADMNSAYLFTQYTAVDPAVTAQTGDNRPIELMLGSVLVFSALAAAAFIVDSKRKYRQ